MAAPKGNKNHLKHGLSHTRIDNIYKSMISRCYHKENNRYARYGGRGIGVCDEWLHDKTKFFEWAFANGYSNDLTLDRIKVNENYSPNNCRWATQKEQSNNTRSNHLVTYNEKTQTIAQWAEEVGIMYDTLSRRLSHGWSVEEALTTPPGGKRKK